jgi:hypothetical protein
MDPITIMLVAATVGALTTGYSIQQGNMMSKRQGTLAGQSMQIEKANLALAQAQEKAQASQEELDRQRTLKSVLASQNAIFGASGASLSSGTFAGIQTADTARAAEATNLNKLFMDTRNLGYGLSKANMTLNFGAEQAARKVQRRTNVISGIGSMANTAVSGYAQYKNPNSPFFGGNS